MASPSGNATLDKIDHQPLDILVRHCYWKYPIIAVILGGLLIGLGFIIGSPNWPRAQIATTSKQDPGGSILAFTQELDGTSSSWQNTREPGMGSPDQVFVIGALRDYAPLLGAGVSQALETYQVATPAQQHTWAANYDRALAMVTPMSKGGAMAMIPSPDFSKINTLSGDFGPIPKLVQADLMLAQHGYLEQYLTSLDPGHSLHLATIWLYDQPVMLNTAIKTGLTDDQWGMVKERGFPVGPWYLIIPAIIHVKFPGGSSGTGFVLWNLLLAFLFIVAVPLVPGLRDLPKRLKLYRFMYRYPIQGEKIVTMAKEKDSVGG